jgi:hypothetical protein
MSKDSDVTLVVPVDGLLPIFGCYFDVPPAEPTTLLPPLPESLLKLLFSKVALKGKCALGPFLSILVIECRHKCLNVNLCPWMNKVQIKSKGMFLSLSTLVLCTNILV